MTDLPLKVPPPNGERVIVIDWRNEANDAVGKLRYSLACARRGWNRRAGSATVILALWTSSARFYAIVLCPFRVGPPPASGP